MYSAVFPILWISSHAPFEFSTVVFLGPALLCYAISDWWVVKYGRDATMWFGVSRNLIGWFQFPQLVR